MTWKTSYPIPCAQQQNIWNNQNSKDSNPGELLVSGTMMIKEQAGQGSPLPSNPERVWTSSDSPWERAEERADRWTGDTGDYSAILRAGWCTPDTWKLLQKKVRPALTSSLEQVPKLGRHGLERRCNPWVRALETSKRQRGKPSDPCSLQSNVRTQEGLFLSETLERALKSNDKIYRVEVLSELVLLGYFDLFLIGDTSRTACLFK